MIDKKIKKILENADFSCRQCSNCCRHDPGLVFLTKEDVSRLCQNLNMDRIRFLKECCREIYKGGKILAGLKEKVNFDCIFWNNGCIVYEARPLQCRTFPFWPGVVESEKSWNEEKKRCNGIGITGNLTLEQKIKMYELELEAEYMEMPPEFFT